MIDVIDISTLMMAVGVLAFLVSVITQVTKGLSFLNKIPTQLQVIVLSIVLSVIAYFSYTSFYVVKIEWYMVVGTVIGGFIVAFVAMFGWEKLSSLYSRFKKK